MLKAVTGTVASAITASKYHHRKNIITFVKPGEKGTPWPRSDWQLKVDLGKQLWFPEHIASANLCPDMIIFSDTTKLVIMVELMVPWEERMNEAQERKRAKYLELTEQCRRQEAGLDYPL